jgi:hypothetical protein
LDSYADTCSINNIACILEYTGQTAEVTSFASSLQTLQDIPIVNAAVAYEDPESGEVIILIINQALYFGEQLDNILLNPNQMCSCGNVVNVVFNLSGWYYSCNPSHR